MTPDDTLVTACLGGDEGAFRLLVDRYRSRLFSLASSILQDADQAADAVQDAFLKAYSSLPEYRGRGFFGAWLRKILVNQCLSVLRQRHHYLSLQDLDIDVASHQRGPEAEAVAHSEADVIRRAMGRLPAHFRTALVLRVVEDLSYREIAQLLSVPESTIETWIHRGRQRMRVLLGEAANTPAPNQIPATDPQPDPARRPLASRLRRGDRTP